MFSDSSQQNISTAGQILPRSEASPGRILRTSWPTWIDPAAKQVHPSQSPKKNLSSDKTSNCFPPSRAPSAPRPRVLSEVTGTASSTVLEVVWRQHSGSPHALENRRRRRSRTNLTGKNTVPHGATEHWHTHGTHVRTKRVLHRKWEAREKVEQWVAAAERNRRLRPARGLFWMWFCPFLTARQGCRMDFCWTCLHKGKWKICASRVASLSASALKEIKFDLH